MNANKKAASSPAKTGKKMKSSTCSEDMADETTRYVGRSCLESSAYCDERCDSARSPWLPNFNHRWLLCVGNLKVVNVQHETRGLKQDVVDFKSDVSKLQVKLAELEARARRNNIRTKPWGDAHDDFGDAIRFLTEMLPKWIPSLSNRPMARAHRIYQQQRSTETDHAMIFKVLRYQDQSVYLRRGKRGEQEGTNSGWQESAEILCWLQRLHLAKAEKFCWYMEGVTSFRNPIFFDLPSHSARYA